MLPSFSAERYSKPTLRRAERAVSCSPFLLQLFTDLQSQSIPIGSICGRTGIHNRYSRRSLSELVAEAELMWLIQVGMLRREVDGQGLTDRFLLTPLGQILVDRWRYHGKFPQASLWDRFYNAWQRWIRLPF